MSERTWSRIYYRSHVLFSIKVGKLLKQEKTKLQNERIILRGQFLGIVV